MIDEQAQSLSEYRLNKAKEKSKINENRLSKERYLFH